MPKPVEAADEDAVPPNNFLDTLGVALELTSLGSAAAAANPENPNDGEEDFAALVSESPAGFAGVSLFFADGCALAGGLPTTVVFVSAGGNTERRPGGAVAGGALTADGDGVGAIGGLPLDAVDVGGFNDTGRIC